MSIAWPPPAGFVPTQPGGIVGQGPPGPQGVPGPAGPVGPAGAPGTSTSLWPWAYNSNMAPPPTSGTIRSDSASATTTATIYIASIDADGYDVRPLLLTATTGNNVYVQDAHDSTCYANFTLSAPPVDNTSYVTYPVTFVSQGPTPLTGNKPRVLFGRIAGSGSVTSITAGAGLTGGTITTSGTIALASPIAASYMPAYTGDVTSTAGTTANTLATVNSNVGTWNNVTINAKGLATAGSNVAYLTAAVTSISAGTGITVSPNPIVGTGAVALTVPVIVANGGTGSSSLPTTNPAAYFGLTGTLLQGGTTVTPLATTTGTVGTTQYNNGIVCISAAGRNAYLQLSSCNTTLAGPTATLLNQNLGAIFADGYGATAWNTASRAVILLRAAEGWSDTAQGTYIRFDTTQPTTITTAERVRIGLGLMVGTTTDPGTNNLSVGGTLAVTGTSTFTGIPSGPTPALNTNTTQLATTAYVIGQASSTNPTMNGTVAVGTGTTWARADHVHPTDTSRGTVSSLTAGTGITLTPATITGTGTIALTTPVVVSSGGTGATTLPNPAGTAGVINPLLRGAGTGAVTTGQWGGWADNQSLTCYNAVAAGTNGPYLDIARSRGTNAIPTATQSGDVLGTLSFSGYGTAWSQGGGAYIQAQAAENFLAGAQGARLIFTTTTPGSLTQVERVRIGQGLMVGTTTDPGAGNLTLNAQYLYMNNATGTVNSTSTGPFIYADQNGFVTHLGTGAAPVFSWQNNTGASLMRLGQGLMVGNPADPGAGNLSVQGNFTAGGSTVCVGYGARSGTAGPAQSNLHNIDWVTNAHLWIDTVNLGQIAFTSDYRIKENVKELPSMWERMKLLRPISYNQKEYKELLTTADPVERWGFIAHELQETLIESAATGYKDAPNLIQSPNPWTLIAVLTKTLQEAMARVESLEAR